MLGMYPALTIFGDVGMNYRVEHSQDAAEPMRWTPLTNLVLTGPSLIWADTTQPATNRRFYRVLVQQ